MSIIFLVAIVFTANAQKKKPKKRAKDTIKTEVVNVITSYTPKVSDATKLHKNPKIKLSKKAKKKALTYTIFSAPVASTFIPKSGAVKGIDIGKKERLYNNYMAAGFGNNMTPFFEMYLRHSSKFENEYGLYTKYISSENSIDTSPLNSKYAHFTTGLFFLQTAHYFDWKISLKSERKTYHWYGVPELPFTTNTLNAISEKQVYDLFALRGDLVFDDSLIKTVTTTFSQFSDLLKSKETQIVLQPSFQFPLDRLGRRFNDLEVATKLIFLKGNFAKDYSVATPIKYSFINISAHPIYRLEWNDFTVKAGAKLYFSSDTENKLSDFFIYPDVHISYPVLKDQIFVYAGASGDLYTNSYQSFVDENPYVSPTLFITTTNEKYHFFGGFSGKLVNNIAFNLKGSYRNVEDKPLFIRNNSKSEGTFSSVGGVDLAGYEYGNSFTVFYDDIIDLAFLGELNLDIGKRIHAGFHVNYHQYTTKNQQNAYNLPNLEGDFFATYKKDKIYITTTIFYVGERKGLTYAGTFPSTNTVKTLKPYTDVNLNGGYHFNDKFSVFLKLNNVLNTKYERFSNFTTQGFQVLGGATWKFDF